MWCAVSDMTIRALAVPARETTRRVHTDERGLYLTAKTVVGCFARRVVTMSERILEEHTGSRLDPIAAGTSDPVPGRHLLIASTGGHLAELAKWSQTICSAPDSLWVTFDSPQSGSLLRDRRVLYVPYVAPRDVVQTARAFGRMMKKIDWQGEGFTSAVTTGAAVGVAGLAAARFHRIPAFYFESVSRVNGPSVAGRLAGLDPWIKKYCQYEHWADGRWNYRGSLLDDFFPIPRSTVERPRLFVTLGTIRPYRFDALVDAVLSTGLADSRTVWQLGVTTRQGLPGTAVSQLTTTEFEECSRSADVVITHAGVGTIMNLLGMGVFAVVVPRRATRKEHVDNHQIQIGTLLQTRGISMVTEVERLDRKTILEASASAIRWSSETLDQRPGVSGHFTSL
jgi:UDP-N-acetylglucosamine transferase subunit ALG13